MMRRLFPICLLVFITTTLGALGTLIQMRWTGGDRGRIGKAAKPNKKKPPKED